MSNNIEEKRKQASFESRRILSIFEKRQIAEDDLSKELPSAQNPAASGRPFFADRDIDFNISHSGSLTAVSYIDSANFRVGCDVEKIRPRKRALDIAKDYFSQHEYSFLFKDGNFEIERFFLIWTLKESYIKLHGLSVFEMRRCPSFIQNNNLCFISDAPAHTAFRLYDITCENNEKYILSAAIEGDSELQPEIRVLTQAFLNCKMTAEIKSSSVSHQSFFVKAL